MLLEIRLFFRLLMFVMLSNGCLISGWNLCSFSEGLEKLNGVSGNEKKTQFCCEL